MNSLRNKVALVTGSARGLGKAIAERFAALGADIVVNYSKDKSSADEVVSNIKAMGVKVIAVQADVTHARRGHDFEHPVEDAVAGAKDRHDAQLLAADRRGLCPGIVESSSRRFARVFLLAEVIIVDTPTQ